MTASNAPIFPPVQLKVTRTVTSFPGATLVLNDLTVALAEAAEAGKTQIINKEIAMTIAKNRFIKNLISIFDTPSLPHLVSLVKDKDFHGDVLVMAYFVYFDTTMVSFCFLKSYRKYATIIDPNPNNS